MISRHILTGLLPLAIGLTCSVDAKGVADPDRRAAETERRMTDDERFSLLWGYMPQPSRGLPAPTPPGVRGSSGWFPGVPRLNFPEIYETDASLGVTNPLGLRKGDGATAMPSGLALASGFDPAMARRVGGAIGREARSKGFNVMLAGGVNLTRDWFGGRNFEYLGEDPWLAGTLAGEAIAGIQAQGVVSTVKHFALNAQETQRHTMDARMGEAALRESDLLAFQFAIERGRPGSVMCAYNQVNGAASCGNDWLLNKVLKREWNYKGWVMSDWGAIASPADFIAGADQESGAQLDRQRWFDAPLRDWVAKGRIARSRVSDAVRRILRSFYAIGADAPLIQIPIDYSSHAAIAREAATHGIVLLKNDAGALPLTNVAQDILVVGQFADRGVMSGGGSSSVTPVKGPTAVVPIGGPGFLAAFGQQTIMGASPSAAIAERLPRSRIAFDGGYFPEVAAARAAAADVVVVFATQWQTEGLDGASLSLPQGQDALIAAVAKANPNTIVVLETGNPVAMPWLPNVKAVSEAWYPGEEGATAIADVLSGRVNPSGRLPMTFPRDVAQAPRASVPGLGLPDHCPLAIDYSEGADVGYRWYAARQRPPLFAFGHGLSYTRFEHGPLMLRRRTRSVIATLSVTNVGDRAGADVPQLYLVSRSGRPARRLAGFERLDLRAGETRHITIEVDPRLLADWTEAGWTIPAGDYGFAIGRSATDVEALETIRLPGAQWR